LRPDDEEAALCERSAAGDRKAFSLLVARHEHRLRRFLTHLAGADVADELAQESFLRAWRALAAFKREASFASWVCGIGWRCYIDHQRRERSESRRRQAAAAEPLYSATAEVEATLDLRTVLSKLAPTERAALILCDGHGWSHGEAAVILAVPVGTVKSTIVRAKRKCRLMLGEGTR
jgi:RNA polymerase sigma factor (sigma-70 family)